MKTTVTTFLLSASLALVVLVYCSGDWRVGPPPDGWMDMHAIQEKKRALDVMAMAQGRHRVAIEHTQEELLRGAQTLEEAAAIVLEATRRDNPRFLLWIEENVAGRTERDRTMRWLLERLQTTAEHGLLTPEQRERADCLLCEFEYELLPK